MSKPTDTNTRTAKGVIRTLFVVLALGLSVSLVTTIASLGFAPKPATAAASTYLNFQSRLLTASGSVVPDGNYNVEFKLYDDPTTGSVLWTETRTGANKVRVANGYLTVNLGSVNAFGTSIDWSQQLYLTMNIGGTGSPGWDGEMSPRLVLTSVPEAFHAQKADTATTLSKTDSGNTATLNFATPSATTTFTIQSAAAGSYDICTSANVCSGYASSSSLSGYVQLQNTTPGTAQTGNLNLTGTGIFGTKLLTPSIDTATAAALNIGTATATSINLGGASIATAIQGNATVAGTLGVTGAATLSDTLTVSGTTTLNGDAALNGNTTLGNATSDTITFTGRVASNINPTTNNTYSLGSDTLRWADIYVGPNTIHVGTSSTDEGTIGYNTTTNTLEIGPNIAISLGGNTTINGDGSVTGDLGVTGSITTGSWQGATVSAEYGGTGFSGYTVGDILYANSTTSLGKLAVGTNGQCLTVASGVPAWGSCSNGVTTVGALDGGTPNGNAATITGNNLYLQSASATNPGVVNTTTQTFAGAKTFNSAITAPTATNTINGLVINSGALSSVTGITTNGGYTQSGTGANTLTGATTVSGVLAATAAGTGFTVTNNATVGGTLGVTGAITGSSTITAGTGLTVTSGGATITAGGLTVSAGGANITGATSVTGATTINTTGTATTGIGNASAALTLTGSSSTTFVLNGTTIDTTEFGRLDGKDAALVDTNDAVATAITGTGALSAGSITSGFGTISTSNNITTSAQLQGGSLNVTGNATVGGTLGVTGNATLSGTLGVTGAITGSSSLTITGTASFLKGTDYSTTGSTNDVAFGAGSLIRLTGASAQTITGIASGTDGRVLTLVNTTANAATIANNSGSSSAANRIITGTGGNITIPAGASLSLVYDSGASLWRVVGSTAAAGGVGVNTIGSIDGQTKSANGAVISGTSLFLQTADASNVGLVSTGAQTFAGAKTFSSAIAAPTSTNTINGLVINSGALSSVTGITSSGSYTQSGTGANTFTGATTFSAANTALSVTNNATIGGTLGVTGAATLGSASITNNATVGGTLGVTGAITGSSTITAGTGLTVTAGGATITAGGLTVSAGGASISGTTSVTGATTVTGATLINTTGTATTGIGNASAALTLTGSSSTTFVLNGTTIDTTEFGRLDGKDAALVDTNDAVNTAITGTGALAAGSITSGFGTISTSNNITTSAQLQGGTLNVTGAVTMGSTISVTGAASLNGGVAVTGTASFLKGTDYSTTGSTNDVAFGAGSLIRLTGASAQTITGIASGTDGRLLTLVNAGANAATIANNSGSSLAANRIITGTGGNISLPAGASLSLLYDSGASLWRVIGDVAATGGSGVNTIGTIDSQTKNSNGAVISGTSLFLQTADASNVGLVSTGAQTFAGAKTFSSAIVAPTSTNSINGLVINSGALSSVTGITTNGSYTQSGTGANTFTGASTFSAAGTALTVSNNATISGTGTIGTLSVTNNATVGGTLGVTGAATLASASITGAATVGSTLGVTGAITGSSTITAGTGLTVTSGGATITAGGLTVSAGGASITGATSVTGATTINTTGTATTGIGNATGALTLTGSSSTTFVLNGTTIDTTEFGRLDGKDAALVDTNDAVNTAITGTGALAAGSITSGFGTISTSNNITTSAQLQGGTLNITGNSTLGGTLAVTGATSFLKGTDYSTTGSTNDVAFGAGSLIRLTGASAQTITGIASGTDGRFLTLVNAAANAATIANNSGSSLAANRIITGTGGNITIPSGSSISMIYDSGASLWRVIGGSAATGGVGVNTVGTIDSQTKSANGAVISGTSLFLQTADASNVGIVSTGAQTFAGAKTFSSAIIAPTSSNTINGLVVNSGALSSVTGITTSGAYTQSGTGANTFTGATTFSAAGTALTVSNNATISGTGTIGTLSVTNNATVGGTLSVTGASTFTGAIAANGGINIATGKALTFGGNYATFEKSYSVNTATPATLVDDSNTQFSATKSYRVRGVVSSTGTNTGATAIFYGNGTSFTLYKTYEAGTNSNHVEFFLNSGVPSVRVYSHASFYTISVITEEVVNMGRAFGPEMNLYGDSTGNVDITSGALETAGTIRLTNAGALQNITSITTSGGYTQSGSSANTFTGATTLSGAVTMSAAGTALTVNNNATISGTGTIGTLSVTNNATIGGTLAVTGTSTFTGVITANGGFINNGATLNTAMAISNLATGGAIGSAATTVDVKTAFTINQTTAGQTLSLPNPTTTTATRVVYVSNIGTQSFVIHGVTLGLGASATFIWNGTTWTTGAVDTGVASVGTIDSQTKSANGAVISGANIYLQTADASNVGLVSTGTQTFAGAKTFSSAITAPTSTNTINGLVINSGALSNVAGITTTGGYTQSGSSANTFTGATTFSAAGTALTVTNNASIGGTLSVTGNATFDTDTLFVDAANNRVGIGTTTPNTTLDVDGTISRSQNGGRVYKNAWVYNNNASNQTGTMILTAPKGFTSTMLRFTIKGYDYSTTTGAWEANISGYAYQTTPAWLNYSADISGNAPFTSVRLGYDGTNVVIMLGTTSTVWQYPKVVIEEIIAGQNGIDGWGEGWTTSIVTDETTPINYTNIVTPTLRSAFMQGGNSYGTTATIGTNDSQSLVLETANTARLTITNAGAATFSGTLAVTGAITGPTATNTINGLVINSGALSSVTGITTSGGYTQSGSTANTLTGATTISATGNALTLSGAATNAINISGAATTAINISNTGVTTDINLQNGETIDNNVDGTIKLTATTVNTSGALTVSGNASVTGTLDVTGATTLSSVSVTNNATVGGDLTATGNVTADNLYSTRRVFREERINSGATGTYYKIATLPVSSANTGDLLDIRATGGSYASTGKFEMNIKMSNRNAFNAYVYNFNGAFSELAHARVVAYNNSGLAEVYIYLPGTTYASMGVDMTSTGWSATGNAGKPTLLSSSAGSTTTPTGSLVFDSSTATPDLTINSNGNVGIGTSSSPASLLSVGGTTGSFQVNSSGAIAAVTGITTSGGYTQSGSTANTLTGATTISATGNALTLSGAATNAINISGAATTAINISNTGVTTDINLQNGETIDNNVDGTIQVTATTLAASGSLSVTSNGSFGGTLAVTGTSTFTGLITANGGLTVNGTATISSTADDGTYTGFVTNDSGVLKYRTAAQVASDLNALTKSSASNVSTLSAGTWYRVATKAGSQGRFGAKIILSNTGSTGTPNQVEFNVVKDWSTGAFIQLISQNGSSCWTDLRVVDDNASATTTYIDAKSNGCASNNVTVLNLESSFSGATATAFTAPAGGTEVTRATLNITNAFNAVSTSSLTDFYRLTTGGIELNGGYTQSGSATNTLTGSTIISAGGSVGLRLSGAPTNALEITGAATTAINISNTGVTTDINLQNGETIDNNVDGTIKLTATTVSASANLSVTSNATVGGTLGVTGATTLSSTLGVSGATTLSSTLNVSGVATLSSDLAVNGDTALGNQTTDTTVVKGLLELRTAAGYQTEGQILLGRFDGAARDSYLKFYNDATAANNYIRFAVHNGTLSSSTDVLSLYGNGAAAFSGTLTSTGMLTASAGLTVTTGGITVSAGGASITGNTTINTSGTGTTGIGNATGALTLTGSSSSTFVLGGTTVDATEFNRLDGKNAALLDTNDAVATAITGTGALNSGSITSGFGAINNGASGITTTGTLTGGTLSVTGDADVAGNLSVDGVTTTFSNLNPQFRWKFGGGTDLNWKKIADVAIGTGAYAGASFEVDIVDTKCNLGCSSDVRDLRYYISAVRSSGVQDSPNNGTVSGPDTDYVRLVKTATGVYELQVRQTTNYRHMEVSARALSTLVATITYATSPADGSTTGTNYTPSLTGHTLFTANLNVAGNATIAAASGTGLDFSNAGITTDISLQNGETIDNNVDGTIALTATNIALGSASTGLQVTSGGVLSDIDGTMVTINDNLGIGGTLNQQITLLSGAGNHGIEIGRTDGTTSTPFLDFHSGTTSVDYDARIIASSGSGASGGGTLTVTAATTAIGSALTVGSTATVGSTLTVTGTATFNSTSTGIIIGGAATTGINLNSTGITTDISLQNNETIDNDTDGRIRFTGDTLTTGISYFANGTTYYVNGSGVANLNTGTFTGTGNALTLSGAATNAINISGAATTGINFSNTGITTDLNLQNGETIDNNVDGTIQVTATTLAASGSLTVASNGYIAGNLGIGNSSPGQKLALNGANVELGMGRATSSDGTTYARYGFTDSYEQYITNNATYNGTQWNFVTGGGYAGTATRFLNSSGAFSFDTASGGTNPITWNNRLTITNTGNVGIGTSSSPASLLSVGGTTGNFQVGTTGATTISATGNALTLSGAATNAINISGAATTAINISNTGVTTDINLQNGETIDNNVDGTIKLTATTVNTSGALTVSGNASVTGTLSVTDDANFDSGTLFVDASTNRVGVGTASPATKLTVSTGNANDGIYIGGNSSRWLAAYVNMAVDNFSPIVEANDQAILFGGTAIDTATGLVIAPHTSSTGGIRLDGNGNVSLYGSTTNNGTFSSTGNAGIGTGPSNDATLFTNRTSTSTSTAQFGTYNGLQASAGGTSSAAFHANNATLTVSTAVPYTGVLSATHSTVAVSAAATISTIYANRSVISNNSSGSITFAEAQYGLVDNASSGSINTARGGWYKIQNSGSGTIQNAYGMFVETASNSGTLTNNYGVYINTQTAGTTDYGLYVGGADTYSVFVDQGKSHFEGKLEVASTSGSGVLVVDGDNGIIAPAYSAQYVTASNVETTHETTSSPSENGTDTAIATDGLPIIAYYEPTSGAVKVRKCSDVSCTSSTAYTLVSSGAAQDSDKGMISLAIGLDGMPVISYYNSTNDDLMFVRCTAFDCSSNSAAVTIDATNDSGSFNSMVIAPDSSPIIAYQNSTLGSLKVAKCADYVCSGSATITTVDSTNSSGRFASIGIAGDGMPIIAHTPFSGSFQLRVAKCTTNTCSSSSSTTVDSAIGDNPTLGVGADGKAVIFYRDNNNSAAFVKCGNFACSSGNISTNTGVGQPAYLTDITFGADGLPIAVSYDFSAGFDLHVHRCTVSDCTSSTHNTPVTSGNVGKQSSIAIGMDGLPIIAYDYDTSDDLRTLHCGARDCGSTLSYARAAGISLGTANQSYSGLFVDTINVGRAGSVFSADNQGNFTAGILSVVASTSQVNINGSLRIGAAATTYTQRVCHSAADGATSGMILGDCQSAGQADLAEMYDTNGNLEPGDLVKPVGGYTVDKPTGAYDSSVIGVVSTNPTADGIIGNNVTSATRQPIALAGRIPVKVSLENGDIHTGDKLTAASTPGYAMKATASGRIIGVALEDYTAASPRVSALVAAEETDRAVAHAQDLPAYVSNPANWIADSGKIMVFANASYYSSSQSDVLMGQTMTITGDSDLEGDVFIGQNLSVASNVTINGTAIIKSLEVEDATFQNVTVTGTANLTDVNVSGTTTLGTIAGAGLVDCDGASSKLLYDITAKQFSCGTETVADIATNRPDVAQTYNTTDATVTHGHIVAFAGDSAVMVQKAQGQGSKLIAGVVTADTGITMSDPANDAAPGTKIPVALVGRVPVLVSDENGSIAVGDSLTASDTKPGYAVKALHAGTVIGRALEAYTGHGTNDRILVYVNTSYDDPTDGQDAADTATAQITSMLGAGTLDTAGATLNTLTTASLTTSDLTTTTATVTSDLTVGGNVATTGTMTVTGATTVSALSAADISVAGGMQVAASATFGQSLTVAGTLIAQSNFQVTGDSLFKNGADSATALQIQTAAGNVMFTADAANNRIVVGAPSAAPTLFVLATKNTAGDPTGVPGAMYYNSVMGRMRCYEDGEWLNCRGYRTLVTLDADVVNNNATANTLKNIDDLSFDVKAGEVYHYYAMVDFDCQAATTGARFSITGPASPTKLNYTSRWATGATDQSLNFGKAYGQPAAASLTCADTEGNTAIIEGSITPSANGTVKLTFASGTAGQSVTALKGSTLEWW